LTVMLDDFPHNRELKELLRILSAYSGS
jgi:hypothetical protein